MASDTPSKVSNDESLAMFNNVRATLQLQNLPSFAVQLRNKKADVTANVTPRAHNCHVVPDPLFGSHHILFKLKFNDGAQWLLKVPANGYPGAFDAISASALRSEAWTMRLIKRETTVPIPEVYHFNDTLHNALGCPFILMEYIEGRPLYEVWFDRNVDGKVLDQRRCRALRDIARATMQLNRFVFPRAGALLFDDYGIPCGIRPERRVDLQAMLDRIYKDDEYDGSNIFCAVGPFSDAKSCFTCLLDRREPPADEYGAGAYKLLRVFLDLVFPENGDASKGGNGEEQEFVLCHPDLAIQNIIVSEDGCLLSLIDWDGVGTGPRCLGNEAYPSWLTRDWDEMAYRYDENAAPGPDCPNNNEDSPDELEYYRKVWQEIIENISQSPASAKRITCNSLLLSNLAIAADNPVSTHSIVERVFNEIEARTDLTPTLCAIQDRINNDNECCESDDDDNSFYSYEIFTGLLTGEISEQSLQRLTRGFQSLLL